MRQDNIAIFLPDPYENKDRFKNFFNKYAPKINPRHQLYFKNKMIIISKNLRRKWEDEDVKYWDTQYVKSDKSQTAYHISQNPRDIVRKAHLFNYLPKDKLKNKIICEIGAGDARSVRNLLNPKILGYYYLPTDYSYESLSYLNRLLGKNQKVYFIQCLGEQLPFRKESLDYLIALGVLHHMPKKERHLKELIPYLKRGGWLMLEEPYLRNSKFSYFIFKYAKFVFEPNHSAHEERPQKKSI